MFFEVETRALLEVFKVYLIFSVFVWQAQLLKTCTRGKMG